MLSRALSLATVTLLIGCFAAAPAQAQATNLEAGKSPSQIFAGTCTACHKSPRGLLKTVPPGSLPGFLRQHYTTSPDMAALLSAYLISNGATDTRYGGRPKQARSRIGSQAGRQPSSSTGRAAGCDPAPARRRPPSPTPMDLRRPKPDVRAATPSGWRGRARRLTPRNPLWMRRHRRRASAAPMAAN